jgi:hypothetical protein
MPRPALAAAILALLAATSCGHIQHASTTTTTAASDPTAAADNPCAQLERFSAELAGAPADSDLTPVAEELYSIATNPAWPADIASQLQQSALAFAVLADTQDGVGTATDDDVAAAQQLAASTINALPGFVAGGCANLADGVS